MTAIADRIAAIAAALFVAIAVTQSTTSLELAVAAGAVLLIVAVGIHAVLVIVAERTRTVGARASAHRESLAEMAEPSHPLTAGRPLGRAPARRIAATTR